MHLHLITFLQSAASSSPIVQRNEASLPSNTNQVGPFPGPENNDATGASDLNVAASASPDCSSHKINAPEEAQVGGMDHSEAHVAETEDSGASGEGNAVDCGSTHNANQLRSVLDDTDNAPDTKSSVISEHTKDGAIAGLKVRLLRIRARSRCFVLV